MKLSEAIRAGAKLRPQAFGKGFDGVGTCAMGAAFEGMGLDPKSLDLEICQPIPEVLRELFPPKSVRLCPVCGTQKALGVIVHLNDEHGWTREAIADYVETLEREQEASHAGCLSHEQNAVDCEPANAVV